MNAPDRARQVDAYMHGLLSEEEARQVEQRCAHDPEWAAELRHAQDRLKQLRSLPPAEPSTHLVRDTLDGIADQPRRWERVRGRAWQVVGGFFLTALLLLYVGSGYVKSRQPTDVDLLVLGQQLFQPLTDTTLRIRVTNSQSTEALAGVPVLVEWLSGGVVTTLARVETDEHGSAAPRFQVPDAPPGTYQLRITAQTPRGAEVQTQSIKLQRTARVMLSTDKPIYQPGQTIHLRALGLRAVDRKPLADQSAVFTFTDPKGNVLFKHSTQTSVYGIASADCPLDGDIEPGIYQIACKVGEIDSKQSVEIKRYVLPKFEVRLTPDRAFYAPGQLAQFTIQARYFFGKPVSGKVTLQLSDENKKAEASLDAQGRATFKRTVPNRDTSARFVAEVVDDAGQKHSTAVERPITSRPVRLHLVPEGGSLVRGVPQNLYLLVMRADGQPVANATVRLEGAGLPPLVKSDAQGSARVSVTPAESMQVRMHLVDAIGEVVANETATLTVGERSEDFLLRVDRVHVRAGETLTLTALATGREPVFVDVLREGTALRSATLTPGEPLALDLPPEAAGTLRLVAYRYAADGAVGRRVRLVHVEPADGLKVETTLDAPEYRPGGKAVLNVALKNRQGQPVRGAVSLVAVDEAVFAVHTQRPGLEQTVFLLEQEAMEPVYNLYPWSPDESEAGEGALRERAAFAATGRTGTGHTLQGRTFPAKKEQLERFQRQWGEWFRFGQTAWFVALLASLYGMLYLYFPARTVLLFSGVTLVGMFVIVIQASRESKARFSTAAGDIRDGSAPGGERWPLTGGPLSEVPRGGRDLTSGELSFGEAESGKAAPRVRSYFPETLLWRPQLLTDDQGRLPPQTIDLADSITSWRLTASAVGEAGQLGASTRQVRVFQPFFVDLNLPAYLTRGDEVSIPVVVYSYLDKPQTVKLKVEADEALGLVEAGEREMVLQPNEVRSTRYTLRVKKAGLPKLRVTARSGDVADAMEREIAVEPGGRRIETVFNGQLNRAASHTLTVPANAIEGGTRAVLKVYPSGFSQLVEGLEGIFRLPTGCFEQTSSSLYPNVMALQYLRRTGTIAPATEMKARQYIHLGCQRLVGFEVPGGGFDWFGRSPANERLTAYGLLEFEDMAQVHEVDPALIRRTRAWLLKRRTNAGHWGEDVATNAYIAWAVFRKGAASEQNGPTRAYLATLKPQEVTDAYTRALIALAQLACEGDAQPWLNALEADRVLDEQGRAFWRKGGPATLFHGGGESAHVETTALTVLALQEGKRGPEATQAALRWLVHRKNGSGTWGTTQATVLALQALINGTQSESKPQPRTIEIRLGTHRQTLQIAADQSDVLQRVDLSRHLVAGANTLEVSEKDNAPVTYQVVFRHHVHTPAAETKPTLGITLAYDRQKLAQQEDVRVTARVTNNTDAVAPMVMLELPVPPGFVAEGFEEWMRKGQVARYQTRPRSVLVYLRGLEGGATLTLSYRLRALLPAKVEVPAARVYEYYNPAREAHTPPTRLEVTPR